MAKIWRKYWRWIIGIGLVYLYPFYCLLIGMIPGVDWPPLLTFGLDLKDFMTVWIALGGVIAVVIGIFQTQTRISQQEKQQRDARFAAGVELLGNPHESARIGAAYNLHFLAKEFPEEYLTTVCEILCAHIRTIVSSMHFADDQECRRYPFNEVQTIIDLLFKEKDKKKSIFTDEFKDLHFTSFLVELYFDGAIITNTDFSQSEFDGTHFENSIIDNVTFTLSTLNGISFDNAALKNVSFIEIKSSELSFIDTKFNAVDFSNAKAHILNFSGTCLENHEWDDIRKEGY